MVSRAGDGTPGSADRKQSLSKHTKSEHWWWIFSMPAVNRLSGAVSQPTRYPTIRTRIRKSFTRTLRTCSRSSLRKEKRTNAVQKTSTSKVQDRGGLREKSSDGTS